jgi:hypothetical protein
MSLLLDSYRKNAEAARLEAERSTLPNVRARAFDVAARWTEMADQLAWVEREGRLRVDATVKRLKPRATVTKPARKLA